MLNICVYFRMFYSRQSHYRYIFSVWFYGDGETAYWRDDSVSHANRSRTVTVALTIINVR